MHLNLNLHLHHILLLLLPLSNSITRAIYIPEPQLDTEMTDADGAWMAELADMLTVTTSAEATKTHNHDLDDKFRVEVHHFRQRVDHTDASKGTFLQRYWFSGEYYKRGGPMILQLPGETDAEPYTVSMEASYGLQGRMAHALSGASLILEHRFFGHSNPHSHRTEKSLKYLTVEQNVADLVYFATQVVLPLKGIGDAVGPDRAPWIVMGASYSGAVASWAVQKHPDIFYAAYASSAVVKAIPSFWQYFDTVNIRMAKNCSADARHVIAHLDDVLDSGNRFAIRSLKHTLGLETMEDPDDVVSAMSAPFTVWSNTHTAQGHSNAFNEFCDALEKDNTSPHGVGLHVALHRWGEYNKNVFQFHRREIYGTRKKSWDTDAAADNELRGWQWLACTQLGLFQTSPPAGYPRIVSKRIDYAESKERYCTRFFPKTFPEHTTREPTAGAINKRYGGWDVSTPRVFFVNGVNDPWLEATVSSASSNMESTPMTPIVMTHGFHASDLWMANANADHTIRWAQDEGITYMKKWLKNCEPQRKTKKKKTPA